MRDHCVVAVPLKEAVDDVAIGAILQNAKTGEYAIYCDYCDEQGFLVAYALTPIDIEDWVVTAQGPDESGWTDDGKWIHEKSPRSWGGLVEYSSARIYKRRK